MHGPYKAEIVGSSPISRTKRPHRLAVRTLRFHRRNRGSSPLGVTKEISMKQIKLNLAEEVYDRLDNIRRKEAPSQRNKTFCRDLLESMITVFEEDYKKKEKKNVRKRSKTRKRSK